MGGTFNPIHYGHLRTAAEVADRFGLEKMLFVPAFLPPHKEAGRIAPARHRMRMAELGAKVDPRFAVSSVEVDRRGTSYTIDTLMQLRRDFSTENIFFLSWGWTHSMKFLLGRTYGIFLRLQILLLHQGRDIKWKGSGGYWKARSFRVFPFLNPGKERPADSAPLRRKTRPIPYLF